MDDFIRTIDSDDEEIPPSRSQIQKIKSTPIDVVDEPAALDPGFVFDLTATNYADILAEHDVIKDLVKVGSKPAPISVDDIISRRREVLASNPRKRKREPDDEDESGSSMDDESGATTVEDTESDGSGEEINHDEDEESSEDQDQERKNAYFASEEDNLAITASSFLTMNLSRPILKALTTLSFHTPTPIQAATIPAALMGKDIVGNAVTGSGKTAAFTIPILERLLFRDKAKKAAATRCLVLVPTRELAVQCFEVGTKLAAHTDIRFALIVGGLSLKAQETTLRSRPDILIATPGRLIDHLRNSPTFNLDALDVLVLDEADRMLSDGFADELAEIVKSCPRSRQTMLFSATMTDSVDELVKMSLDRPVRLFVDPKRSTARGLVQEFIRVKAGKENDRASLLVTLCVRTFKKRCIIFYRSKKLAHQMRVLFGFLGLSSEELHGDLTQEQRLNSLQLFRDGKVDYLMATDLASRGLDIKGIETVINYDMPGQFEQYLHRVGRTARAGKNGRSVTLVGEADRKMLKAVIKHSGGEDKVRHRMVPTEIVEKWTEKLKELEEEVEAALMEEKESKQLRKAEMELQKGQNMIEHEADIFSRPARTWFQSSHDKAKAQETSKKQYEAGFNESSTKGPTNDKSKPKRNPLSGLSRKAKRRKLAKEEDDRQGDKGATAASIRLAKKEQKPTKIGEAEAKRFRKPKVQKIFKKKTTSKVGKGFGFGKDAGEKSKGRFEGTRARKDDAIGSSKKGGPRKSR